MEWARLLAYITGTVDQELLQRNEYLAAENRILKAQIRGRLCLSNAGRATLGEIGHRLGRRAFGEVANAALRDTILGWYYVLFFIHLQSRKVDIAGITGQPDERWMQQIARNVTMEGWGALGDCCYLRWQSFLKQHASAFWACDFFCVQTITFKTLYVFFVIHHASRQVLHVHVTQHPTASWTAQQIVECCTWDRVPARFLVHDRDSCYGSTFDRRVRNIGIAQIRTPFRSPRANAIAERWVRSVRTECLDHVFIFNDRHLQKGRGRVRRLFQPLAPASFDRTTCALRAGDTCASSERSRSKDHRKTCARLRGLHHVYQLAA